LPTTLVTPFLKSPISFGQVPPVGENTLEGQPVITNGYSTILQGSFNFVAAVDGTMPENAVLLWNLKQQNGGRYSLYMSGVPRDNVHPQRGFICDEESPLPPPVVSANNNPNGNPLLENCTPTGLSGISIDVFNTSLYGPNSPDFPDREQAIQQKNLPVLQSPADIMCLTELDFVPDIQQIVANAGPVDSGAPGRFPYSYWVKTGVGTAPSDPRDLNGQTPPAPTTPPCGGSVSQSDVTNAFDCMVKNCNTTPGMDTGFLPGSTDCLSTNCSGQIGALLLNTSENACFDCIIDYVASDQPYTAAKTACINDVQVPYGFGGQLPNLILSRYPFVATDYFVLPSSQYRQGVLYARVQLEDQQVDFYCGFFTSTLVAQDLPYTGNYGNGGNPNTAQEGGAYANEQWLQAKDLVAWVATKSGSNPAIIVGDWRASVGVPDAGAQPPPLVTAPSNMVPGTIGTLANGGWQVATAPGWTPQCTYCPQSDNPLNVGQTVGYFMTQPFLYNWPANAAQEESLIYTTPIVQPTPSSGFDAQVPLSQYFGLNIQVTRPQVGM
jgi:hypothetical protein